MTVTTTRHLLQLILFRFGLACTLLLSINSHAQPPASCDCLWHGAFSEALHRADFIVSGKVISSKGNSADIHIDQRFFYSEQLQAEYNEVIRVWGNNGKLCRPEITQFPEGTRWLFALNKITEAPADGFNPNTPNISFGRTGDYYLSRCGAYWLQLHEDYVTGNLVKGRRWSWDNNDMNPVLIHLVKAYIEGTLPEQALIEAAKPRTEVQKLMEQTKGFLRQQ